MDLKEMSHYSQSLYLYKPSRATNEWEYNDLVKSMDLPRGQIVFVGDLIFVAKDDDIVKVYEGVGPSLTTKISNIKRIGRLNDHLWLLMMV